MTDDERAIRELVDTWMRATKSGDADTVLGLMTDDVVFMVPGQEPFGKEAFAAAAKGMKGAQFEGRSEIREIKVLGDWAYLRNRLEVSMTPPGGRPRAAPATRSPSCARSRGGGVSRGMRIC